MENKKKCFHYESYTEEEPVYDMDSCRVDHYVQVEHGFCNKKIGDPCCLCGGIKMFCDISLEKLRDNKEFWS